MASALYRGLGEVNDLPAQHHVISEYQPESELGLPHVKACAPPSLGLVGMGEGRVHGHRACSGHPMTDTN